MFTDSNGRNIKKKKKQSKVYKIKCMYGLLCALCASLEFHRISGINAKCRAHCVCFFQFTKIHSSLLDGVCVCVFFVSVACFIPICAIIFPFRFNSKRHSHKDINKSETYEVMQHTRVFYVCHLYGMVLCIYGFEYILRMCA